MLLLSCVRTFESPMRVHFLRYVKVRGIVPICECKDVRSDRLILVQTIVIAMSYARDQSAYEYQLHLQVNLGFRPYYNLIWLT
jgi:hypothetical protein